MTSVHTGVVTPVCTHSLNIHDIIVSDDNVMLLSYNI